MQNKGSCNRKIPYYNRPIQLLDLAFPVLPHYGKRQNCYLEENNNEDDCAIFRTVDTITFTIGYILPLYIVECKHISAIF